MKELIKINGIKEVNGMRFHEVEGGFGEGKKSMLAKEIAEIHQRSIGNVNKLINDNRIRFKDNIDIVDLDKEEFAIVLSNSGIYTQNSINASNNIYLLSERGYSKLLKIMEDDLAWKKYDELVDNYFNMREAIKNNGMYAKGQYTVTPKEELECLGVVSGILNFNDNSKLIGVRSIYDKYGMETSYLPVYTPSKGVLKSPTALLKQFNVDMSTIEFNKKLIKHGILRECERQSTKDKNKVKKFKNLVDNQWGENQTSPKNPKETQPLYYEDKFADLLKKLGI